MVYSFCAIGAIKKRGELYVSESFLGNASSCCRPRVETIFKKHLYIDIRRDRNYATHADVFGTCNIPVKSCATGIFLNESPSFFFCSAEAILLN